MKFPVLKFLLRKTPQPSSHSPTCASSSHPATVTRSNASAAVSAATSSLFSGENCLSEDTWSNGLVRAQSTSSTKSVISSPFPEYTGRLQDQFFANPARSFQLELEEAFKRFDANHDGKISVTELGFILRSLGDDPSEDELVSMVKEGDRDGDGFIDLEEFMLLNAAGSSVEVDILRDAFSVFDADHDGKISVKELHCVLSRLGESCTMQDCSRMIGGIDRDGDGFVDFEEFCSMMGTNLSFEPSMSANEHPMRRLQCYQASA